MIHALLILAISTAAHAGKLAEGYRSMAWGPHAELPKPPGNCVQNAYPGITWACAHTIGVVNANVFYMYKYGLLYAVSINAEGHAQCTALNDALTAAWGEYVFTNHKDDPGYSYDALIDEHLWSDGTAVAFWQYKKYVHTCAVSLISQPHYKIVSARDAAAGAEAL